MPNKNLWLTKEAFEALKTELDHLVNVRQKEIAKEIQIAREDGDLKENAGYHAAKEEQGKIYARIVEIEALLKDAIVGEPPKASDIVEMGTVITALVGGREQKFLYAGQELATQTDLKIFSPASPIGQAIGGLRVGQKTKYSAPSGDVDVEILAVENFIPG